MKMKAVVEVALVDDDESRQFGRLLDSDRRRFEHALPAGSRLVSAEHVAEADDLRAAFKKLLRFKTEGLPPAFQPRFRRASGYEPGDESAPFYSERFLYPLLGKEDARTVLGMLRKVMKLAGIDMRELEIEIYSEIAAEEKAEKERVAVTAKRKAFRLEYVKAKKWDGDNLTDDQRREIMAAREAAGVR